MVACCCCCAAACLGSVGGVAVPVAPGVGAGAGAPITGAVDGDGAAACLVGEEGGCCWWCSWVDDVGAVEMPG